MEEEILSQILTGLKNVHTKIDSIETTINDLRATVMRIEKKQLQMEEKQDIIYQHVAKLTEYYTETGSRFDEMENNINYVTVLVNKHESYFMAQRNQKLKELRESDPFLMEYYKSKGHKGNVE